MTVLEPLLQIQDVLDQWRTLGNRQLPDGTERITRQDGDSWLHTIYPPTTAAEITALEHALGARLPSRLRALYRRMGGLTLFDGAFELHGLRRDEHPADPLAPRPQDLAQLDRVIGVLGWKPRGAVAFATNAWDLSVHVVGMGNNPEEVVRCDRMTGRVLERHHDVLSCVASRLTSLDNLFACDSANDSNSGPGNLTDMPIAGPP